MDHEILINIGFELESAKSRYPWWPTDVIHAGAIVAEEAGELTQATLDHVYAHLNHNGKDTVARMRKEAIQTAAMAIRFLENMEAYTDPGRRVKADPISHEGLKDEHEGVYGEALDNMTDCCLEWIMIRAMLYAAFKRMAETQLFIMYSCLE